MKNIFTRQLLLVLIWLASLGWNTHINAENWTYGNGEASYDQGCQNCNQNYSSESKAPRGSWQNQFEETKKPHTGVSPDSAGSFFMLSALN